MISVHRFGNYVVVEPSCEDVLRDTLSYNKRIQTGPDPRNAQLELVKCYHVDEGGRLIAPFGLTPRIINRLRECSVPMEFKDSRKKQLPDPDLSKLDPLRDGQDVCLAAIMSHECGIIEAPTGSGKGFTIRQICKIWPTARILIVSYSREIVLQIRDDLLTMFPTDEIGLVGAGGNYQSRVTCAVDRSLGKVDLDSVDIVIYDEVHRAGATCAAEALAGVTESRMYGFSASPKGRGDGSDLEVEALFGPVIYASEYQQVADTGAIVPVEVYAVSCDGIPQVMTTNTTVYMERNHVWKSNDRNSLIADSVAWARQEFGVDCQILISVKTVVHAVHLGALLPDFALVYGSMDAKDRDRWERQGLIQPDVHPLTVDEREAMRRDFKQGKLRRAIATGVWGTGVDFPGLNVIIRADAQASTIANTQISGRVTRSSTGKAIGVLIDFDDSFNTTFNSRWKKRKSVYRRKGWSITPILLKR